MTTTFKSIMLADDDEDDVQMFKEAVLEVCPDLELNVASNGLALLKMLKVEQPPDVIFLDLNMPGKNGKECLLEIRQKDELSNTLVVILSTSAHKAEIDYCLANGADRYYVKPPTYSDLKTIVYQVCNGELKHSVGKA